MKPVSDGAAGYKKAVIYFWSGTGNSLRVASWIGRTAEENDMPARVISIDKMNPEEDSPSDDALTGIVFPTHGFTAPWHVIKFISKLPRGKSRHFFCVTAKAGLKYGNFILPGISGSATFVAALILFLKGYSVRGIKSINMPSNWYSFHPIQKIVKQKEIIDRAEDLVTGFTLKIIQGKKVWFTLNNLIELLWGAALSLISLGYLLMGRFFLAKLFFANSKCDGCGICEKFCSARAIKMRYKENPRPFWTYKCESCMRCSAFCPRNAVEAGQSWGVTLYFITAVPFSAWLFSRLNEYMPWIENLQGSIIGDIVDLVYFYPSLFISYFVFITLLRIPAVNWIFTHTTMTHFSFWGRYHEPDTRLKNF